MLEDLPAMDLHLIQRWGVEILLIVILSMPRKPGKDAAVWRTWPYADITFHAIVHVRGYDLPLGYLLT